MLQLLNACNVKTYLSNRRFQPLNLCFQIEVLTTIMKVGLIQSVNFNSINRECLSTANG